MYIGVECPPTPPPPAPNRPNTILVDGFSFNRQFLKVELIDGFCFGVIYQFSEHVSGTWLAGETLCNIWLTVDYINCNATCFSILAIGIDRYWSVAHPFHYRTNMSKQWVAVYISFIWIIPTLLYVPLIFIIQQFNIFDLSKNGRIEKCQVHFRSNFFWVFAVTSVNFWVVLVVLSVLYIKIYKVTKFFWSRRSNRSQQATPNIRLDHSGSHPASRQNQSSSQLEFGGDASNNNNNVDVDAPAEERNQLPLADVRSSQSEEYLSKKYTKRSSKDMYFKMTESNLIVSVSSNQMAPCQKRRDSNQLKNNRHWPDDPKAVKLAPKFKTGSISLGVPSTDVHPFRRHSSACPGDVPKTAETPSSPSFQDARLRIKRVSEAILRLPLQLMENMTEQKTSMRILTSIMTSFVICWSPYSVVALIHSFGSELISAQLVEMVYGFCYISCLVNPIVYTCANKAFRDAFKRILRFNDFPFCCLKTKYKIPSPFYATTKV